MDNNRTDWLEEWVDQMTYEHEGARHVIELAMEQELWEHYKSIIEIQSHTPDTNTGEGWYVEYTFDGKPQTLNYTLTNTTSENYKQTDEQLISNLATTHLQNLINETWQTKQ